MCPGMSSLSNCRRLSGIGGFSPHGFQTREDGWTDKVLERLDEPFVCGRGWQQEFLHDRYLSGRAGQVSRDCPPVHGVVYAPTWLTGRESNTRTGANAWNNDPDTGVSPTTFRTRSLDESAM